MLYSETQSRLTDLWYGSRTTVGSVLFGSAAAASGAPIELRLIRCWTLQHLFTTQIVIFVKKMMTESLRTAIYTARYKETAALIVTI